ncbi:hypothetical protein PHLCEN_2v12513 [Hermanssonia centrifuga]|uniref:Terpenoid synthase n=1 Tax=Hermanssonia centrifuga TaxID=98765 RepID=A0A2R6NGZ7_9APHY|nr:hypothetical protein PHLCEN_2v12513 [Hermanssonia centrifuga]
MSIRDIIPDLDGVLEHRVRNIVDGSRWSLGVSPQRYEAYLMASVNISGAAYGHTPLDVQVHIALYNIMVMCIDDFTFDLHALQEFSTRLHSGLPQLHPVLEYLVDILHRMPDFYLPYVCKAITSCTVDFINMNLFEKETEDIPLCGHALRWVKHKRALNGIGNVYAFFIFDKFSFSDINAHIQANPDVLSFYKEELAGETRNFIHDRAVATNKSVIVGLTDTADETLAALQAARSILKGQKEKDAMEQFMVGYAVFHFQSESRYYLKELTGSEFI